MGNILLLLNNNLCRKQLVQYDHHNDYFTHDNILKCLMILKVLRYRCITLSTLFCIQLFVSFIKYIEDNFKYCTSTFTYKHEWFYCSCNSSVNHELYGFNYR